MNRISTIKFQQFLSVSVSLLICLFMTACGGGSSSSGSGSSSSGAASTTKFRTGSNVVALSVDGGVFNSVNAPFVSVTVCSTTNTSSCLTIDHILVDTGSVGLRIFNQPSTTTAALSTLGLSAVTDPANSANSVGECLTFVQGNTWGPMKTANITIGQKSAGNVAIQVIDNTTAPTYIAAPAACTQTGTMMNTPKDFGANGVLGIGLNLQDCGALCVPSNNSAAVYFDCSTANGCVNIGMPLINQIQNPVSQFSSDNNGVILSFNSVAVTGATSVAGTLTFGIDTETNNASQNQNTILADINGNFVTTFEGATYAGSYLDSGSNGLFFNPPANYGIAICSSPLDGFYCPNNTENFSAQISGQTGSSGIATVSFSVANTLALFNTGNYVFANLGGTETNVSGQGNTFDWGLPFFLGRDVYVAFEGQHTTKATGPYFGF